MSGIIGNNIVRNGLVLCLDAGSPKSCTGQPVTNLLTYSDTINSVWYGYCGPTSNITYNTTDVTDPLGTNTAVKVVRNGSNGCFGGGDVAMGLLHAQASDFLVAGKTYTTSVYLRGSVGGETIYFGLNDTHQGSVNVTTSWVRYSYTFTNISSTSRGFQFVDYGINHTYYVWGPQTVLGTVAGDYVASVGATNGTKNLTFRDLSGNNNGTFTNAPVFSSSNLGTITFDGLDDYVALGTASTFLPTSVISINCWVKTNDISNYKKIFVNVTAGTQSIQGVYLSIGPSPYNTYFGIVTNNGEKYATYATSISTTNYTNLCGTYDGTNIRLYVNGILVATEPQTGTIGNGGVARISGYDNGSEIWNGNISLFSMYNRALSASEILQNFNATRKRFNI